MARAARVLELLELLQSVTAPHAAQLAQRLEVDERTIRRDIDLLREIGIPVTSTRGRLGGYRIAPGHRMPPLMLSDAEALAVLVGLSHTAASGSAPVETTAIVTAIAKLRRSLPRALAEEAAAVLDVAVLDAASADRLQDRSAPPNALDPSLLLSVATAVRDRRPLAFSYRNRSDVSSDRSIQPWDVIAYRGRWYVVGLDAPSQQQRTFRLDRMTRARQLGGTFPRPPAHDPLGDLVQRFATADYLHEVRLKIQGSTASVREHLPSSVAVLETVDDQWTAATIRTESLGWIPSVLCRMGVRVIVEAPAELKTVLANAARALDAMATSGQGHS